MSNAIIITAYNKPELLYLCINNLICTYRNEELEKFNNNHTIFIVTEEGYDNIQDQVLKEFYKKINIFRYILRKHNSDCLVGMRTILNSYSLGLQYSSEFFILLEEDMIPTIDYVKFNETIYNKYLKNYDRILCGAHKRRPETEKAGRNDILIADYQCTSPSVISCEAARKYILPHIKRGFDDNEFLYANPFEYYKKYFPNSRIPPNIHMHHDGFIERIMEQNKLFTLKPDLARASHIGLNGVTCRSSYVPRANLTQRLEHINELMDNRKLLKSMAANPEDTVFAPYNSLLPVDLKIDINRMEATASSWHYDVNNEFKDYYNSRTITI